MSIREALGFDDRWVMLVGIPIIAFFIPILFFRATLKDGLAAFMPEFISSLVFTAAYWTVVRSIFIFMRRRFQGYQHAVRRILYTLGAILIAFFLVHSAVGFLHDNFFPHPDQPGVTDFDYAVGSLTIVLLVSAIYESVYLYARWRESIVEQERLRRENIQSQLEGLKNQVNPHFLFNSLNTLIYIIPEDPQRAVQFVQKLSKVYRYILEIREKELIPLEEELTFLDSFIFLVQERFGENLRVDVEIPDAFLQARIIPLSLQILFENAIKHNVISEQRPLTIELFVDEEQHLVVRNNLQRKKQVLDSTRVGLDNIRSRYAFFTDEKVVISEDEAFFTVSLPLLKVSAPQVKRAVGG